MVSLNGGKINNKPHVQKERGINMNTERKQILFVTNSTSGASMQWQDVHAKYEPVFAPTDEKAIELFNRQMFEMVVLDHTCPDIDFRKLYAVLPILQENVPFLPYHGEEAEILLARIEAVELMRKKEKIRRYLILDPSEETEQGWIPFSAN